MRGPFPLHTVAVVLFCQLDICFFPVLVASPSHNVLPISSVMGIIRAACHLPSFNLHSLHSQILDPGLIMFLQLLCHNLSCSLHVINPALIWSSSKTQNTSMFTQLPRAQRLGHTLCESPFSSAMKHRRYTSRVKCRRHALADWNRGVTNKGLFREEQGVALRNPVPHTCFRATSAVQPCAQRFHTLSHMPSIFSASFAHDFDGLSWLNRCRVQQQFSSFSPSIACSSLPQHWSCPFKIRIRCSIEPAIAYKSSAQHR